MLNGLLSRLLRTETLITILGVVLFLTGRVESMEEALTLSALIGPYVLGRSYVKGAEAKRPSDF